jgi:alpha-1,3-fucosyltransferase
MQKYINVDVYGKCGNLTCTGKDGFEALAGKYKFYLAFENALCPDYVTEKFFRALMLPIVPIVMGGDNYKKLQPPGAYIDVNNFHSVRALTEYLTYLDENPVSTNS